MSDSAIDAGSLVEADTNQTRVPIINIDNLPYVKIVIEQHCHDLCTWPYTWLWNQINDPAVFRIVLYVACLTVTQDEKLQPEPVVLAGNVLLETALPHHKTWLPAIHNLCLGQKAALHIEHQSYARRQI